MNLIPKAVKDKFIDEQKNSEYDIFSTDEYLNAMQDLNYILNECDEDDEIIKSINKLIEIKNHIDKFGVSEETLSLFGNDLNKLGIINNTSKEDALVALEDIIEENTPKVEAEGSEEFLGIAVILSALFILGPAIIIAISGTLSYYIIYLGKAKTKLLRYKSKALSVGFKDYDRSKTSLHMPSYKNFKRVVDSCEHIVKYMSDLDFATALKTDFKTKLNLVEKLGYDVTDDNEIIKIKDHTDHVILVDAGYSQPAILSLIDDALVFCTSDKRFKIIKDKINAASKMKHGTDGKKLTDEEKLYVKEQAYLYKKFINITVRETQYVINKILKLCKKTIN